MSNTTIQLTTATELFCELWHQHLSRPDDPDLSNEFLSNYAASIDRQRITFLENKPRLMATQAQMYLEMEKVYFHVHVNILLTMIHSAQVAQPHKRSLLLTLYNTFRTLSQPIVHTMMHSLQSLSP